MDRDEDARIDALVRQAAEAPVNEARMAARLNAALAVPAYRSAWGMGAPGLAVATFAAVLVATPVIVARTGGPGGDDDAVMAALAFGDPRALDLTETLE
jgi:hypothetical protein